MSPEILMRQAAAPINAVVLKQQENEVVIIATATQGPAGTSSNASYVHTQGSPATVWTIQHMLNMRPAGLRAFDQSGNEIEGAVSYPSLNVALLTLSEPVAGSAYLS